MKKEKLTIIKIGGNVINNPENLKHFLRDFSNIQGKKILVHGGGKDATRLAESLGIETVMVEGRRITDQKMLEVVVMTYAGLCNKKIIAQLQAFNTQAIGLTGADGNSILARRRENKDMDYGYVGDVVQVNSNWIKSLLDTEAVPVFCAITHNKEGQLLNTNADTIAQSLAVALSQLFEVSLIYCFEKKGVLLDIENENSVVELLTYSLYQELKNKNLIHSGMLPKLENCFKALEQGVKEIRIANSVYLSDFKTQHTYISI